MLLALFQEEGRLVDFLKQDIVSFSDADVGAAARVVHEGCNRALRGRVDLEPIRPEAEGDTVTVAAAPELKLVGHVSGAGPYQGVLRHRGWRASSVNLPTLAAGADALVMAQVEVELG